MDQSRPGEGAEPAATPAVAWDSARVLALAADVAARQAALRLAAGSWAELGQQPPGLVWGRVRGSARQPYDVVADPQGPDWSCSCPSRQSPCKHVVALLLLWTAERVSVSEPADFAVAWRERRRTPAEAPAPRPSGELADPEAAAARVAARGQRVADGLDELDTWLGDQLRQGLAGLERGGAVAVEQVAARMVDAQAPGLAGMLRALPGELARPGWPERVLEQLGSLHLLVQAHRRLSELPDDLAATVRSRIGYPVSRAEVLAGPGVEDIWEAVGQLDALEGRLETRRVWLWGQRSRRWALWLTFAPPGQAPDSTVTAGARLAARLHFYPGAGQYRAVVGEQHDLDPAYGRDLAAASPSPAESVGQARLRWATLLAADPWASRMPAVLLVTPVPPDDGGPWRLRDGDGCCRQVIGTGPAGAGSVGMGTEPWPLLAYARGRPVPVVVEWSDAGVRPLAVLDGGAAAALPAAA